MSVAMWSKRNAGQERTHRWGEEALTEAKRTHWTWRKMQGGGSPRSTRWSAGRVVKGELRRLEDRTEGTLRKGSVRIGEGGLL